MCSGGGGQPQQVQPAAAPAPPEPAPIETSLTEARRKQGEDLYGTTDGSAKTRFRDESSTGANIGGSSRRKATGATRANGATGLRM